MSIYHYFKKLNYFLKIVLLIVLFSKFVFADKNFKIKNVQNNISILDIHGKRYNASPEIIIKTGDFLSSKKNPALIIIGYNKLCFFLNKLRLKLPQSKIIKI